MLMKPLSCEEGAAATKEFGFIGVAQEILETIVDGFCAVDKEWRIVYVNLPACEMWGFDTRGADWPHLLGGISTIDGDRCRKASPRCGRSPPQGGI
jgi:PAS domain-containing protein